MESKLIRILARLLEQTNEGKLHWEDASRLTEGEKFIAGLEDAIVEIRGESERSSQLDDYGNYYQRAIAVQILNLKGLVVTEQEFTEEIGQAYTTVEKLFLAARSSARRSDAVLDSLLQKLGA